LGRLSVYDPEADSRVRESAFTLLNMPNPLKFDVIVAGSGIAGVAAAVSAARLGVSTALVERYGFLGGLATAGLVNPFMSHCTSKGDPLIAGFYDELRDRLAELDGIKARTFDSETMKYVLQEMCLEAGVRLYLHSWVSAVEVAGSCIKCVTIDGKGGPRAFEAGVYIDATGDGDLAAMSGAPWEKGRAEDGLPQSMTLMFDIGGVDFVAALRYVKEHPDQMRFPHLTPDADVEDLAKGIVSVAGYYDLVSEAKAKDEFRLPGDLVFYISRPRPGEVVVNTTHIGGVDGTDPDDLTRAEIETRRQTQSLIQFFRKYIPGFANSYLLRTAPQVGVRETRRIMGEYVLSADDVLNGTKFSDANARLAYPVDVHSPKGNGYTKDEVKMTCAPPPGDWYEIPYRCLVPLKVDNLLVAGRCVSSTHEGQGAIRIMPCCAAMG
jgi:hypothetical protein